MDHNYKNVLAVAVLNEENVVSYRMLSRQLKVHVNLAKQMLYDFHHGQNARKPGSVHATYIVDGKPRKLQEVGLNEDSRNGEDEHMQSSPFMSSSMPQEGAEEDTLPVRKITLAREEDLEAVKKDFELIYSIHIYSLEANPIKNLQVLSDCNRTIFKKYASEDPLVVGKQFGVIQNSGVRRRTGRLPPGVALSVAAAKTSLKPNASQKQKDTVKSSASAKPPELKSSKAKPVPQTDANSDEKLVEAKIPEKKSSTKPTSLKREQSDIFKSFSKPKAKPKKEDTDSSAGASPAPVTLHSQEQPSVQEDEPMKDASEDEQDDDLLKVNQSNPKSHTNRAERAEQLRKMMDDHDEEMILEGEDQPRVSQDFEPLAKNPSPTAASPEPAAVTVGGRRRGRRKIMKKKTSKDEEGYLVTKEEPAWESFSEDEPPPTKVKPPASTSSTGAKGKASVAQTGQGSIMSFFGKK